MRHRRPVSEPPALTPKQGHRTDAQSQSRRRRGRHRGPLRRRQSQEQGPLRGRGARHARRQHAHGAALRSVSRGAGKGRGRVPDRSRRPHLHRLPRRVHGRPLWAFGAEDPARHQGGAGRRPGAGRPQPLRGAPGRAHVPALPGPGAGPLLQFGLGIHAHEPEPGARRHGPRRGDGLQRRLPRRLRLLRGRRLADQRPLPLCDGRLQRHRGHAAADRPARQEPRGHHHRADDGQRRLHSGRAGIPARPARGGGSARHRADLRRGHDLAAGAGRAARQARRHPGSRRLRQIPGRRGELRRLRRQARPDAASRSHAARRV